MTPEEVLGLLQTIARQQVQINHLEATLMQERAKQQPAG